MGKVTVIPATRTTRSSQPLVEKRKVAGYARVSTDSEEQATSYEAQVAYYKSYIKGRDDWEYVDIYTDEGISATNTRKRDGFNRMIKDALEGKIEIFPRTLIQYPSHRSVENSLKQRLSADWDVLPKAFFFYALG